MDADLKSSDHKIGQNLSIKNVVDMISCHCIKFAFLNTNLTDDKIFVCGKQETSIFHQHFDIIHLVNKRFIFVDRIPQNCISNICIVTKIEIQSRKFDCCTTSSGKKIVSKYNLFDH